MKQEKFGNSKLFVLENDRICLRLSEIGASMQSLRFAGRELILSMDDAALYEDNPNFCGVIAGRYANRIGGAAFTIGGRTCRLPANENGNILHGGKADGYWSERRWAGEALGETAVRFALLSPDGDNGFPGNLTARVTYTLTDNRLRIDFEGDSDADTYYCPTTHTYWQLCPNALDTVMTLPSRGHLEVDDGLIPTGKILPAEGDFDLNTPRRLGVDFDDCFVLAGEHACTASGGGVTLTLHTDYPGLQLYTGSNLQGAFAAHAGFAIEPQFFPDSPNKPAFPDALLRKGEHFRKYAELCLTEE